MKNNLVEFPKTRKQATENFMKLKKRQQDLERTSHDQRAGSLMDEKVTTGQEIQKYETLKNGTLDKRDGKTEKASSYFRKKG